jgi:hypothetical protein
MSAGMYAQVCLKEIFVKREDIHRSNYKERRKLNMYERGI